MELFTSYFAKVGRLMEMGHSNLVCVAGCAPAPYRSIPNARFYPDLAPRRGWWMEWHSRFKDSLESVESRAWYVQRYHDTVLSKLDPQTVLNELGDRAVMLCHEPPYMFCHRHIIARWLGETTGTAIREVMFN